MPLLKATGLTIILPGAPVAPAAPGATQLLNVPYFRQEQTNWCWAACCEMVFHYYGDAGIRQCDMATAQFGGDCCTAPASSGCNQGNWPEYTYAHYSFR